MMAAYDSSSQTNMTAPSDIPPSEQASTDVAPPVGVTPPQILAQDAAVDVTDRPAVKARDARIRRIADRYASDSHASHRFLK